MFVVAIDAGHGGSDPGAVSGGVLEADLIRQIVPYLIYDLGWISQGKISIILTSPIEDDWPGKISLRQRAFLANEAKADICVSVHINSATTPKASGFEVLYCPVSKMGLKLAQSVHNALDWGENGDIPPRRKGPITDADTGRGIRFTWLWATHAPAIIAELGFASNPHDLEEIQKHCSDIAACLAEGIWNYLKEAEG